MTFPTMPTILSEKILRSVVRNRKGNMLEAQFGQGFRQVARDGINSSIDLYKLEFAMLEGATRIAMLDFLQTFWYDKIFLWTPLGEPTPLKWRIDKDSITEIPVSSSATTVSFSITQQFDLG